DVDTLIIEVLKPLQKQNANDPGLVSVCKMFMRRRLKAYQQALEAVQSDRFRTLLLDTAEWIEVGPWRTSRDALICVCRGTPIEIYAAHQLSRYRKKIRRRGEKIGDLTPEQMHRLRIQVKKARYAIEFFAGLYQDKKAAKRCKEIRSS